jgi:hypothetical protein
MSMKNLLRAAGVTIALCFAAAAPLIAADAAAPQPSGKWILYFDGSTSAGGVLTLRIAPAQGDSVEVTTKIPASTHENSAAELVAGTLKGQLGGGYSVKVEDGEKVYIKNKGKTPKFVVTVASSTLTDLKLKIKRS